jgi:hypothetical protein
MLEIMQIKLEYSHRPYGEFLAKGYGDKNNADAVKLRVGEKIFYNQKSNSCIGAKGYGDKNNSVTTKKPLITDGFFSRRFYKLSRIILLWTFFFFFLKMLVKKNIDGLLKLSLKH